MDHRQKLDRNIRLYYITEFLANLWFTIPIWVAFQRQYLSFTEMSLLTGGRWAITAALELPTGVFADLVGRKKSSILGLLIFASGLLTIGVGLSAQAIIIGSILMGVGEAFVSGSTVALVFDSLKELGQSERFSKVQSKASLLIQASIIISSILGGYFYAWWMGLPYVAIGIFVMIAALVASLFEEPIIDTEKFSLHNYILQTKRGVRETFKNRFNASLSFFYMMVGGITWAWQIYFNQIYATGIGYGEIGKSWLFAIIRFLNVIVIIRLLHLNKLVTKRNVFLFFPLLILLSALPVMFVGKTMGTMLLFFMTMGSTLRFIVLDQYTNDVMESRYRATALSTLNLYVSLFYVVFVSLSGLVIDRFGVGTVYSLVGVISLVTLLPTGIWLSKAVEK